jgi:AcrR family transcriptional regulator
MPGQEQKIVAKRLPHGHARRLILNAAEVLFSNANIDAVSFRDLAREAGVSLSAIHYNFGSKEGVLTEVFAKQAANLVDRRVARLKALKKKDARITTLNELIDAFIRPAFEVTQGDRNDLFNQLLARLSVESSDVTRQIISKAFDENDLLFISEIQRAAPHLSKKEVHWRFHFLVGSMIYTMSDAGQLSGLSSGTCDTIETETTLAQMTSAFIGLFLEPGLKS